MRYEELIEDTEVSYHQFTGIIRFVSKHYVTLCIRTFSDRSRDVCLLVYSNQWGELKQVGYEQK